MDSLLFSLLFSRFATREKGSKQKEKTGGGRETEEETAEEEQDFDRGSLLLKDDSQNLFT